MQGPTHSSHPAIGAERERCARHCDKLAAAWESNADVLMKPTIHHWGPLTWKLYPSEANKLASDHLMEAARHVRRLAMMISRGDQA